MNRLLAILLTLLLPCALLAADKRITELGALTNATDDDLLVIVDNPSGAGVTKNISVSNFLSGQLHSTGGTMTGSITNNSGFYGNGVGLTNLVTITNHAILWVDPNGNDSTAVRGVRSKPYLSISSARTNAADGDVIWVHPGTYTNQNDLLRAGINYHFDSGATVVYQQTSTNDAGWGIFDDRRVSGGTTNIIDGDGVFKFLGTTNGQSSAGAYSVNTNTFGLLVVTNPNSVVHFRAKRLEISGISQGGIVAAIAIKDCQRAFVDVDEISDPKYDVTTTINDSVLGTSDFADQGVATYWELGEAHVRVGRAKTQSYGVWANEITTNNSTDLWYSGDLLESKIYVSCHSSNFRTWFNLKEILVPRPFSESAGAQAATFFGSGKHYLIAEKLAAVNTCLDTAPHDGFSNVVVWATVQKLADATRWVQQDVGTMFLNVEQFEDTGSTTNGGIVVGSSSGNGILHLTGGYAKLTGAGVGVALYGSGTARINGLTMDTSAGSGPPIYSTASGMILRNCVLVAPSSTNSITATNAQTVKLYGTTTANRDKNSNITTTIGTLAVDPSVQ